MNIVFMGTPEFALGSLQALFDNGHNIIGVFTQPDKPKGRGKVLTPPPVKVFAESKNIPVFQPKTLKNGDALEILQKLNPEVIVVAAYGKILPKEIIDLPKYGCINVHASLLPKYRGAGPISWCVINGEEKTGITTMQMDVGLDTGDMLLSKEVLIGENETAGELSDRLKEVGASLIVETLERLDTITPIKQDDSKSTYAPMLSKELSNIDWNKSSKEIHNLIRGLNPWPSAVSHLNGITCKIHKSKLANGNGEAGKIISLKPLTVACGDKAIEIVSIQREGRRIVSADEFLCGSRLSLGDKFE